MRVLHRMALVVTMFAMFLPHLASADISAALRGAARSGAGLADDVPTRSFERLPTRLEAGDASDVRHLDVDRVRATINAADPALLRQIDELAPTERDLALQIFEGGRVLRAANPDGIARARLIAEGGADLLVAAQRYGDDVAKPAYMLQIAEEAGQVPAKSVARFSEAVIEEGPAFVNVWSRDVVPNWKKLVTAGAVAACLSSPETCADTVGNLAGRVAKTVAEVGTEVVIETTKGTVETIWEKITGADGAWLVGGIAVFLFAIFFLRWLVRQTLVAGDALADRALSGVGRLLRRVSFVSANKETSVGSEQKDRAGTTPAVLNATARRTRHDRNL